MYRPDKKVCPRTHFPDSKKCVWDADSTIRLLKPSLIYTRTLKFIKLILETQVGKFTYRKRMLNPFVRILDDF